MWLDELPFQVSRLIAQYVSSHLPASNLLNLALTTPKQHIVVRSVAHLCMYLCFDLDHERRLLHKCINLQIRIKSLTAAPYVADHHYATIANSLKFCHVEQLKIPATPRLLWFLARACCMSSVRHLTITTSLAEKATQDALIAMVNTATVLKELVLECVGVEDVEDLDSEVRKFVMKLTTGIGTKLELIHLNAFNPSSIPYPSIVLQKFRRWPPNVFFSFEDSHIDYHLRKCHNIRLVQYPASVHLALMIAHELTELELGTDMKVSINQLRDLRCCTKLRSLTIQWLSARADFNLGELLNSTPMLHTLRLTWGRSKWMYEPYEQRLLKLAMPDTIRKAVEQTPRLSILCLWDVRIRMQQIEDILECMGTRLRQFGTTLLHQQENPVERLKLVLCALAKHNPNLQSLQFPGLHFLHVRQEPIRKFLAREIKNTDRAQLNAALNVLQSRAKFLDSEDIVWAIDDLCMGDTRNAEVANSHVSPSLGEI